MLLRKRNKLRTLGDAAGRGAVRVVELRLEVRDFEDPARWRWVLTGAGGAFLADHEVRLDDGCWQFEAFTDLLGYLTWHVAPGWPPAMRRLTGRRDEARIVADLGGVDRLAGARRRSPGRWCGRARRRCGWWCRRRRGRCCSARLSSRTRAAGRSRFRASRWSWSPGPADGDGRLVARGAGVGSGSVAPVARAGRGAAAGARAVQPAGGRPAAEPAARAATRWSS